MLKNEHLDVRTVTLGINLLDCASHDVNKLKNKIQTRIMHFAENLVYQCDRIGQKFGIPVVNKRIAVSPIAVVGAAMSSSQMGPCSTSTSMGMTGLWARSTPET